MRQRRTKYKVKVTPVVGAAVHRLRLLVFVHKNVVHKNVVPKMGRRRSALQLARSSSSIARS